MTYAALHDRIRRIGQAFMDLDLSVERPLLILSENSLEHAQIALAAQHVGVPSAAVAPAYALVSKDYGKLRSIVGQITPGAVFARDAEAFVPAIEAVFDTDVPVIAVTGPPAGRKTVAWDDALRTQPTRAVAAAHAQTGPDTVAKFMFTSGTTGSPKAVIQTQRMLCSNMEMVRDCYAFLQDQPPVLVDWAPWNHVASGSKMFNLALYNGGTFHIDAGKPSPQGIGETIRNLREVSPTLYFNVPAGFEMLVGAMRDDAELSRSFFADLDLLLYAGAGMAGHTWDALRALSVAAQGRRVLMGTGLGSTETAPFALFCTEEQDRPGNVGIPSRGVTLKLVPNEGRYEVRLKGPNVTPGYWRNPELTAQAFDEEDFYRMGDALRFAVPGDPARGFFFDGRTAENFKLATGIWVGVGALRAALVDALGGLVRDAVITGEDRAELGALLVPFRPAVEAVVPGGADLADPDLHAHPALRDRLSALLTDHAAKATGSAARISHAMVLTEPLSLDAGEVTDKGSVNQRAVLRHRADLIETLYSDDPRVLRAGRAKATA